MRVCIVTDKINSVLSDEVKSAFSYLSECDVDIITLEATKEVQTAEATVLCYPFIKGDKNKAIVEMVMDYSKRVEPDLFIVTYNPDEIVPLISEELQVEGVLNCLKVHDMVIEKEIYSGNAVAEILLQKGSVISPKQKKSKISLMYKSVVIQNVKKELVSFDYDSTITLNNETSLEEEDFVIICGYGIESKENVEILSQYAKEQGAVLCGTKKVIDMGWLPPRLMIGQTGHTIQPNLLITVGVSGAAPLLNGIKEAKKIISINKDKDARIFLYSDYGIIGDFKDVFKGLFE